MSSDKKIMPLIHGCNNTVRQNIWCSILELSYALNVEAYQTDLTLLLIKLLETGTLLDVQLLQIYLRRFYNREILINQHLSGYVEDCKKTPPITFLNDLLGHSQVCMTCVNLKNLSIEEFGFGNGVSQTRRSVFKKSLLANFPLIEKIPIIGGECLTAEQRKEVNRYIQYLCEKEEAVIYTGTKVRTDTLDIRPKNNENLDARMDTIQIEIFVEGRESRRQKKTTGKENQTSGEKKRSREDENDLGLGLGDDKKGSKREKKE